MFDSFEDDYYSKQNNKNTFDTKTNYFNYLNETNRYTDRATSKFINNSKANTSSSIEEFDDDEDNEEELDTGFDNGSVKSNRNHLDELIKVFLLDSKPAGGDLFIFDFKNKFDSILNRPLENQSILNKIDTNLFNHKNQHRSLKEKLFDLYIENQSLNKASINNKVSWFLVSNANICFVDEFFSMVKYLLLFQIF